MFGGRGWKTRGEFRWKGRRVSNTPGTEALVGECG